MLRYLFAVDVHFQIPPDVREMLRKAIEGEGVMKGFGLGLLFCAVVLLIFLAVRSSGDRR